MEKVLFKWVMITVVCNVDDLKVSHNDPFEVTKFSKYLSMVYWNKLKVHRVKINDYL